MWSWREDVPPFQGLKRTMRVLGPGPSGRAITSRAFRPQEKVSYQNRAEAIPRGRYFTVNSGEPDVLPQCA
jgi:hypothetical protein